MWHVHTDGSTRHERRQTFSGWAARAVQPETRQIRQASGARPGGTSLDAETEAILVGLRLVPAGASAWLYSDLDPVALLGRLGRPDGEAARAHLKDLWVHVVARNEGRHPRDVHQASRDAEHAARDGTDGEAGLGNLVLAALDLARVGEADAPVLLHVPRHLPGTAGPLRLTLRDEPDALRAGGADLVLTLALGAGRHDDLRDALTRTLTSLTRGSLVELDARGPWHDLAVEAIRGLPLVRLRQDDEE